MPKVTRRCHHCGRIIDHKPPDDIYCSDRCHDARETGVIVGDFRKEGLMIQDESIDVIFCDPPYDHKSIPLYADLAKFAARVLKRGGFLLAYTGVMFLDKTISALAHPNLEYFWAFSVIHKGLSRVVKNRNIRHGWKPILAFNKKPQGYWWDEFSDVLGSGREKDFHPWQQAVGEAEDLIYALCPPEGIVCDPVVGSGTTLVAAKRLGRRYLGFEIDQGTAERARARITKSDKKEIIHS